MTTAAERKFVNLRKRLDQLGYRQPLGVESLPLVEKLFSDLVHTTESLRSAKLSAGKIEKECSNYDAIIEPYKTENAKLTRENNELHLEILKLKEQSDRHIKDLKASLRRVENEAADLRFLNNQYVHKIKLLEKESKAKTEKIQQLQEKNLQAVVQTPGGRKRNIPFRRQRMQIDQPVPPSGVSAYPVPQPEDPYIADLLQVADNRIQELQSEVTQLQEKLEISENGKKNYSKQVELRDKEIERLMLALDGGRSQEVISLESRSKIVFISLSAERELVLEIERMRLEYGIALGDKSPSRLDAFVKTLEDDRDYYKRELEYLQKMIKRRPSPSRRAPEKVTFLLSIQAGKIMDEDLKLITRERDELQSMLDRFEKHMIEIQSNVKLLTAERDRLNILYEQKLRSIDLLENMKNNKIYTYLYFFFYLLIKLCVLTFIVQYNVSRGILNKIFKNLSLNSQLKDLLSSRDREISSLRRQLDASHTEIAETGRVKEIALKENRRLQDDLATMTRENQAVSSELEDAIREKEEMKTRVHNYITEVSRFESLIASKEKENQELLEKFRMLHTQAEDWEIKAHQAEGESSSIRLELLSVDTDRRHLRERVELLEKEIQEHMIAHQAYESQISSITKNMSKLEEDIKRENQDKSSVLADLTSVRELCVKLEASKDLLSRQLASKSMDYERVSSELEDVKSEAELLKKQLSSERLTIQNLETLLATSRDKEFQNHLTSHEKDSEIQLLKDKLTLAEGKLAITKILSSEIKGSAPSPLLSTGEAPPVALCPVLGSPVQE
uniref:Centrosomal protein 135 n=1 Tax=Pavo cristatus TaxID=9049 RepID=A0A8C9G4X2_PAVCR